MPVVDPNKFFHETSERARKLKQELADLAKKYNYTTEQLIGFITQLDKTNRALGALKFTRTSKKQPGAFAI